MVLVMALRFWTLSTFIMLFIGASILQDLVGMEQFDIAYADMRYPVKSSAIKVLHKNSTF
jgi:hypothetical protein